MPWLYFVAFIIGAVNTTAGSAAQIVLTQIVPRSRLVEAHAKNALASATAEVTGPAAAGALIKLTGAPIALLANACLLLTSASILRGVPVKETPSKVNPPFWAAMREGLDFVRGHKLLVTMASCVGIWQMCSQCATVVQILVCDPPARALGARRGIQLCCLGRRHGVCERQWASGGQAPGARSNICFGICHFRHGLAVAGRRTGQFAAAFSPTRPCC